MVSTKQAPLSERALDVLQFILQHQKENTADLCLKLGPALLQALQRISVESMEQGRDQGYNARGTKCDLDQWSPTFFMERLSSSSLYATGFSFITR